MEAGQQSTQQRGFSRPHRRHVLGLGSLISAATICPRRENRRPCPPCRRAVPPSVTVQRSAGVARRIQAEAEAEAGTVVCLSRQVASSVAPVGLRTCGAQASKIGCTAGSVSVSQLYSPTPT